MRPDDSPTTAPSDETASASTQGTLEDEQIFCPVCGYNLTGNLTGRCSECGSWFHRAQLLEATRISVDALMPWERPDEFSILQRFWKTVRISFFRPKEFALAFAAQPRVSRSTSFYLICLVLMVGVAAAIASVGWLARWPGVAWGILPATVYVVLILIFPIVTANVVVGVIYYSRYRHADAQRHLRPWRAILEYATAHWLMGAAAPLLALLFATVNWKFLELLLITCTFSVWVGCSLLWALTLKEVVRWRTGLQTQPGRVMALTLAVAWSTWIGTIFILAGLVYLVDVIL